MRKITNLSETLKVVSVFLEVRGHHEQEEKPGVRNGRFIYDWCKQGGPGHECEACVEPALHAMFKLLEDGSYLDGQPIIDGESEWTRASTNAALKAGGFPELV